MSSSDTSDDARPVLPVDSLRDAAPELRRPFTKEAVRWKIQTVFKENAGCVVVPYIDARLVVERFNAICPHLWATRYERVDDTHMLCHLTVDGVTRTDVGSTGAGGHADKMKSLLSDSLKRAAVHFGVGVSIYSLPNATFNHPDKDSKKPRVRLKSGSKPTLVLTDYGTEVLAAGYGKWLTLESGGKQFGEPLNHGDVAADVLPGGTFEEPEPEAPPVYQEASTDPEAVDLIERARLARGDMPVGQFDSALQQVWHDKALLIEFVESLELRPVVA